MEHMTVGDDEKKGYFLTPKGKTVGEETFVRMQILAAARVESPSNAKKPNHRPISSHLANAKRDQFILEQRKPILWNENIVDPTVLESF